MARLSRYAVPRVPRLHRRRFKLQRLTFFLAGFFLVDFFQDVVKKGDVVSYVAKLPACSGGIFSLCQ